MILFNLCGAAGCGKSTAAAYLFAKLKMAGFRAELVGEYARDVIYNKTFDHLNNQLLMAGKQYDKMRRLALSGFIDFAVADSPLIQGCLYSEHLPYHEELKATLRVVEEEWEQEFGAPYNIWINRMAKYDAAGRYAGGSGDQPQTEADVLRRDVEARKLVGQIWLEVDGNPQGLDVMVQQTIQLAHAVKLAGQVLPTPALPRS
jgi:hypothetical protein